VCVCVRVIRESRLVSGIKHLNIYI